jgi:hypothetical protein
VVATGALGKPKIAADASAMFDDSFVGETLHSSEYYDAERFHGKDVLVVGGGSSAVEIAVDLARAADSTTMSIRGDPDWVFPRHGAFGESLRLCGGGDDAPLWVRNLRARATFRLKHGKLARYGMQPKGAPLNRRIVVSDEFYPLIAHGAIHVNRGGVKSVAGDVVTFQDGSKRRFDAVVLCTGYDVATSASAHPYLKEHLASVARNASEVDANLQFYLGCFLPDVERCSFVGGCFGFAAVPRIAELQAKAAVNVIMGVRPLPDAETQRRHIRRALAFHVQRGNTNVYTANAYYRELLEAAGEMRSAGAVHLGVKAKGLGAVAGVLGLCAKAVHAACHRSRRIKNRLERQNVHVDLGPGGSGAGRERRRALRGGVGFVSLRAREGRDAGGCVADASRDGREGRGGHREAQRDTPHPHLGLGAVHGKHRRRVERVVARVVGGVVARVAGLARDQDGGGHHVRGPEDRRVAVQDPQGGGQGRVREVGGRVRARFPGETRVRVPQGVRGHVPEVLPPPGEGRAGHRRRHGCVGEHDLPARHQGAALRRYGPEPGHAEAPREEGHLRQGGGARHE